MRIDRSIRTGDKKKDSYIEALEDTVESFNGSNVKQLIRSIDNMAGKLSQDMDLIASSQKYADGTEVELSNKLVDTFLKFIKEAHTIKNFADVVSALEKIPEQSYTEVTTTTKETIQSDGNAFEEMVRKVKGK